MNQSGISLTLKGILFLLFMSTSVVSYCLPDREAFKAPPDSSGNQYRKFTGLFYSKVSSGGLMLSGETVILLDSSGRLIGHFMYREKSGPVYGKMSDCVHQTESRILACKWTDKYGTGFAKFIFSVDFSSFKGLWNTKNIPTTYPWTGKR